MVPSPKWGFARHTPSQRKFWSLATDWFFLAQRFRSYSHSSSWIGDRSNPDAIACRDATAVNPATKLLESFYPWFDDEFRCLHIVICRNFGFLHAANYQEL